MSSSAGGRAIAPPASWRIARSTGAPTPPITLTIQSMPRKQRHWTLASALALLLCAAPLAAQVQVNGIDNVRFGNLLGGIPKTVLRTNASAAGKYNIITPGNRFILIAFTLPTVMAGPGGATMPISFAGTTAGYSDAQAIGSQIGFSPSTGTLRRSTDGLASVFLGGTVTPAAAQAAGSYTATVTLNLTVF